MQSLGAIMSFRRVAGFAFWFLLTCVAFGQQKTEPQISKGPPQKPTATKIVRSYPAEYMPGFKRVWNRTDSGPREVITEIIETPGMDGRFETTMKTTTETVGIGSPFLKVTREVFGNGANGALTLIEKTIAEQETFPDGASRTITNAWGPDGNGHLNLWYRQVEQVKLVAPDVQQTETIIYLPDINQPLRETERIHETERQIGSNLVQTDIRREFWNTNGEWQTTETREQEVRTISPAEVLEEETVRTVEGDGKLTLKERTITRRSSSVSSDQVVTEMYSSFVTGWVRDPS